MSNTPIFPLPEDQSLMAQTFLILSQMVTWNIALIPNWDMTIVAEDDAYKPNEDDQPVRLTQAELNDLTQDLNLSKDSAQLLGSCLKEKHLLASGTMFYWYRDHERELRHFSTFHDKSSLVYCNNIAVLIKSMGLEYDATQWRFFIDSFSKNLKAVLLHNGNSFNLSLLGIQYK